MRQVDSTWSTGELPLFGQTEPTAPSPIQDTPVRSRTDDRDTSKTAAMRARWSASKMRVRVLRVLRDAGPRGMTDEQIATELQVSSSSPRGRRADLVGLGYVEDMGTRTISTGGTGTIWAITDEGRNALSSAEACDA